MTGWETIIQKPTSRLSQSGQQADRTNYVVQGESCLAGCLRTLIEAEYTLVKM